MNLPKGLNLIVAAAFIMSGCGPISSPEGASATPTSSTPSSCPSLPDGTYSSDPELSPHLAVSRYGLKPGNIGSDWRIKLPSVRREWFYAGDDRGVSVVFVSKSGRFIEIGSPNITSVTEEGCVGLVRTNPSNPMIITEFGSLKEVR